MRFFLLLVTHSNYTTNTSNKFNEPGKPNLCDWLIGLQAWDMGGSTQSVASYVLSFPPSTHPIYIEFFDTNCTSTDYDFQFHKNWVWPCKPVFNPQSNPLMLKETSMYLDVHGKRTCKWQEIIGHEMYHVIGTKNSSE